MPKTTAEREKGLIKDAAAWEEYIEARMDGEWDGEKLVITEFGEFVGLPGHTIRLALTDTYREAGYNITFHEAVLPLISSIPSKKAHIRITFLFDPSNKNGDSEM